MALDDAVENIFLKSESLKAWAAQFQNKRYLFEKVVGTGKDFYVGVRGLRGIGKTVLLLQAAGTFEDSAYFSCDWAYVQPHSIYDVVSALRKQGVKNVFIDEVHTRAGWEDDVKTLYDEHEVRLFFTGSSSIELKKTGADLSRRVALYDLKPVSFREFLNIRKGFSIPAYAFKDVLKNCREISVKHAAAFEHFDEYMKFGGVMYSGQGFREALENSLEKIISKDLAALRDVNAKYEQDAYKLLYHVSTSPPFEASFSSLSAKLGTSKTFVIRLVSDLAAAGVIKTIYPCKRTGKDVKKEPKIFMTIPFRTLFTQAPDKGTTLEEFFANHANASCYFKTQRGEKTPDFLVEGVRIEVGGKNKDYGQAPDYIATSAALCKGERIPLFIFGFLH